MATSSYKIAAYNNHKNHLVNRLAFKKAPREMNYKFRTNLHGISVPRNHFIYDVTEDVISAFVTAGIPQYLTDYIENVILRKVEENEGEVRILEMEDFKACFVIFLVNCAISILGFFGEIFVYNFVNCFTLIGLRKSFQGYY